MQLRFARVCRYVGEAGIAWKAQLRLHGRYKKLIARGKRSNVAITAVARELVGFIWDIARRANPAAA